MKHYPDSRNSTAYTFEIERGSGSFALPCEIEPGDILTTLDSPRSTEGIVGGRK